MTTYSVLAKHVRKIAHYEGIREGQASVLRTAARALDGHPEQLKAAWDAGWKAAQEQIELEGKLVWAHTAIPEGMEPNPYREKDS